jgi:hypothetical protein
MGIKIERFEVQGQDIRNGAGGRNDKRKQSKAGQSIKHTRKAVSHSEPWSCKAAGSGSYSDELSSTSRFIGADDLAACNDEDDEDDKNDAAMIQTLIETCSLNTPLICSHLRSSDRFAWIILDTDVFNIDLPETET